ncbi:MAG: hypothetical protein KAS23_00225 [Anaerohalosphaera sp.]|nr:hypothetical protein [Anaerohalosphaera sp.]
MAKIKIDSTVYSRLKQVADSVGYSSVDEFINHIIEKELAAHEQSQNDEKVTEQLKGLGYID